MYSKCQCIQCRALIFIGDTFQIELEFRNVGFLRRGENQSTQRKTSRSKDKNDNKLKPHLTPSPGIEPVPHWWDASALATVPSLLPHERRAIVYMYFQEPVMQASQILYPVYFVES